MPGKGHIKKDSLFPSASLLQDEEKGKREARHRIYNSSPDEGAAGKVRCRDIPEEFPAIFRKADQKQDIRRPRKASWCLEI